MKIITPTIMITSSSSITSTTTSAAAAVTTPPQAKLQSRDPNKESLAIMLAPNALRSSTAPQVSRWAVQNPREYWTVVVGLFLNQT